MLSCSIYKKCNKKSWIEDFCSILDRPDIIPNDTMSKGENINTITRLTILIFLIMCVFNYKHSLNFLTISIIIILILYFINTKEHYNNMDKPISYKNPLIAQNTQSSKKLSIEPIIVPRAHDKDVWSFPSYRHSAVNYNQSRYDLSEEFASVPQVENYKEFDLRTASYTDFTLDRFEKMIKSKNEEKESTPIELVVPNQPTLSPETTPRVYQQQNYQSGQYDQSGMTDMGRESTEKFNHRNDHRNDDRREKFYTPLEDIITHPETPDMYGSFVNVRESDKRQSDFLPNQHLLLPKTITSIYGPGAVTTKEKTKYLANIQPSEYSYSDVTYPINSNLGISYTPDNPPMVLDQVATPIGTYPLFHSIDPQLVRDQNIPPERLQEIPRRTAWSAKYSGFDAGSGTVNFEDIYDPRFNSYGDPYRSYGDVNLGQIQYYYGDVDAYRYPNFGIRSKVDFIDYTDPMGRVLPEYDRNVGVEDIKQTVHDQYNADAMYFREDLQERLMRKRNRELWQLRAMPVRKNGNASSFTSLY
jgi:hypothetical protein